MIALLPCLFRPPLARATALLLVAALAGCTSPAPTELAPPPTAPAALTATDARLSDAAMKADHAYFELVSREIAVLPAGSPTRAAATLWLRAARTEHNATNPHDFVADAARRARALAQTPADAPAPTADSTELAAWQAWIAHRRIERGFRAALPLIREAALSETTRPAATPAPGQAPDLRPADIPDALFALQTRLATLSDQARISVNSYGWAKAQAWLDFALDLHFLRNRSGIVREVTDHATRAIEVLEKLPDTADTAALTDTPSIGHLDRVRPDLWQLADALRPTDLTARLAEPSPMFATLAQLEVQLAHAALVQHQAGPRAARPYLQAADRLAAASEPTPAPSTP